MEVSFRGKFISRAEIQKRNFFNRKKYSPKNVSFVKLDAYDDKDYKLILELSKKWQPSFVKIIEQYSRIASLKYDAHILTKQKRDFENLKPKKVLGIIQTWKYQEQTHIEYLQVNPKYTKKEDKPRGKYKSIGTAFIECFKNLKNVRFLTLNSTQDAKKFYEKQGFVIHDYTYPNSYVWQKPEQH